jgi:glyoxylase-like metal-dependent hydrolase (beta-lactamase superfamily II)
MPEFSSVAHPAALPSDSSLVRGRRSLGDFELTFASDGTYLLDGGAMFGVVPKVMWQRKATPDTENRILLGLNTVVVRTGSAVVLIETGVGDKQTEKGRQIHQNQMQLPASLAACGVRPKEVTHVVNTHLHFDHCGWNTTLQPDGSARPTFPNARYFAHRGEVEHGRLQLDRDKVSYLAPNFEPLIASGQMTLVDEDSLRRDAEIVPGVWMEVFPGHTAQMMGIHVESAGEHACYIGDLYPTSKHLNPSWVMAYDLDPVRCIAERKRFLARAVEEDWLVMFPHDHQMPAARLRLDEQGRPVAEPAFPDLLR